jgi:hypothetical protein
VPGATVTLPPARTPGPGPAAGVVTAAVVVLAATALLVLSCEAWYRTRDSQLLPVEAWDLAAAPAEVKEEPLGDRVESMLGYDEGFRRKWTDERSRSIDLIYMRWFPGRKAANAGPHAPDWCQQGLGREITQKSPMRVKQIGRLKMPYQIYTIADGSRTFYLLFTLNDGRLDADWVTSGLQGVESHAAKRLHRVQKGIRNSAGQVALQIALVGESDPVVAERELLEVLQELVVERKP